MIIEKNKKYLVTGGSGFLGVSLIKEILKKGGKVRTIARNEGKLIDLKLQFGENLEIYTGDVSNMFSVFQFMSGDFCGVFHLAAFKHVPLAEEFSIECINSNLIGSLNVLKVATDNKLDFIIGISTDKAAQVAGVYGATKLLMERAFFQYSKINQNTLYRIVRYGNVLYSTGSVLCIWKNILTGSGKKELLVTDLNTTRFFWSLEQAVQLIFDCLNHATDATPYVPTMKAIKMIDLANAMILKYGKGDDVTIKVVGLKQGENLHEKVLESGPYSNEVPLYTTNEILQLI